MAKAQPLYTIEEQYTLLDRDFPYGYNNLNLIKYRLLMACSDNGNLEQAKNRFLSLIQDTDIVSVFSSLLEAPISKPTSGVRPIIKIHKTFSVNYGLFDYSVKEISKLGVPRYTTDLFIKYFYANEDPVYKLSVMAAVVMMAYIKDDEINNRKGY